MKMAVASTGEEPDEKVSAHAARAPFYLIYDTNAGFQQAIANPYVDAERGAGRKAAELLVRLGVQLVVAEDFGERFADELEADGIKRICKTGVIKKIIIDIVHAV